MDDIKRKRLDKAEDNTKVSVIDALEKTLDELRRGTIKANKVLILLANIEDGVFDFNGFRAGVTRLEEAGILSLATHRHLKRWLDPNDG